jgi:predicted metal-dependent enzyme (double-stranded beta helix superfamily)
MALISVLPRSLDEPLPAVVLADLAARTADRLARSAAGTGAGAEPGGRWHVRLRVTDRYDVWLIGWGVDSGVELHDHGASAGAIALVHGALVEHSPTAGGDLRRQPLTPNGVHGFAAGQIHDVVNESPDAAMSVHVYSPPLASMTFYDRDETPIRTETIDLPGLVEDR